MKSEKSKGPQNKILCSSTNRYLIYEFIGQGCNGRVARAVNTSTSQEVAIKILDNEQEAEFESKMLEMLSILDPVKTNVLLDMDLYQLFDQRQRKPLTFNEIRPMAFQFFTAFDSLKHIGVVHADVKPDNIMLVNHQSEPFRVKLIDFGMSINTPEDFHGDIIQALGYRVPEILLGLPFSEAIDMWGTPSEYFHSNGDKPTIWRNPIHCLDDLIKLHPEMQNSSKLRDRTAFVSLLKGLLETDPERRITPEGALLHPFLTMVHPMEHMDSPYSGDALKKKDILDLDGLDVELSSDGLAEEETWKEEVSVGACYTDLDSDGLDEEEVSVGACYIYLDSDGLDEEEPWKEEASVRACYIDLDSDGLAEEEPWKEEASVGACYIDLDSDDRDEEEVSFRPCYIY
ncbi:homeodomain-interacting protein kinase 2-like [Hippoglossus hippoglossus]|uniref:homeodomain-interacting protein kinase 2-like n=1 Tax=Hippoglossus hippoglossus TaxID=8267 RepID=UPI00148D391C|nr:homeodomain-interacting protein kinase 2-like [Hippoglossus hippoglossus]